MTSVFPSLIIPVFFKKAAAPPLTGTSSKEMRNGLLLCHHAKNMHHGVTHCKSPNDEHFGDYPTR